MLEEEDFITHIDELVEREFWGQAAAELGNLPVADIAEIISRYDIDVIRLLFNEISDDLKPDVLAELDNDITNDLTEDMPSDELSDIVTEMDPDDAADVLGELDKARSAQIIEQMDKEEADDVRKLMTYPDDSAGGIMTTDLITMRSTQTVIAALDAIANFEDGEHIYQVYVVDEEHVLLGIVSIWQLLRQKDRSIRLHDIMETEVRSVRSDTDQEEVARAMAKYDLSVIPVVDAHGALLGRITHDDIIEVIQEEAEEDIFRMAGSDDEELGNTSVFKSCCIRLPWLAITLVGGMITSALLNQFSKHFAALVILVAFIPNIMAMGGNTGLQSSVLLIREIASGSSRRQSMGKLFRHELSTGALMGLICGIGIFIWAKVLMHISPPTEGMPHISSWYLAGVVSFSLFAAMSFAAGFGAVVPIMLKRCKIDPAVASGPFISVMNDISALIIYYVIAILLLMRLL